MKNAQCVGRTISRLAVVAKDFSTYYIPGVTYVGDKEVIEIIEEDDHYVIMGRINEEGAHIAVSIVNKSAPCVVDWTDVYEVDESEFTEDLAINLISFGNYLFERYSVQVMSNDTKVPPRPLYQRKVTDADLQNWKEEFFKNTKTNQL